MILSPIKFFKSPLKFSDIKFNKGMVKRFGFNYTGVIDDILRNGDTITLSVEKGRITQSIRKGQSNFKKLFFPITDKLHDSVYKYDENGKLLSRARRIMGGFEFCDGQNRVTKTTLQNIADETAIVIKESNRAGDATSIITFEHKKPHQIKSKTPYGETKVLADFQKGYLNVQKGKYFAKMEDGILEIQDKNHNYLFNFNDKTLSLDGAGAKLIQDNEEYGYDLKSGTEKLRELCKEFVPQKMGNRFYEEVLKPMLEA